MRNASARGVCVALVVLGIAAFARAACDTTTTSTTVPHVCGNGTVEGPTETCDDGNAVDENTVDPLPPDPCPADCRIKPCLSPGGTFAVDVDFSVAPSVSVAGYKVFIDYPEDKVSIPGGVGVPPAGTITNDPTQSATPNDLDYGIIVVAAGINAIPSPRLFTINFARCNGATPPIGEFACHVKQASDTNGNDVPMTCSVVVH